MTLSPAQISGHGDHLYEALRARTTVAPLTARAPGITTVDAYHVSRRMLERRLADGEQVIGKKIGVTSKAVQEMLDVHQPDFGFLTDRMQVADARVMLLSRCGHWVMVEHPGLFNRTTLDFLGGARG